MVLLPRPCWTHSMLCMPDHPRQGRTLHELCNATPACRYLLKRSSTDEAWRRFSINRQAYPFLLAASNSAFWVCQGHHLWCKNASVNKKKAAMVDAVAA